MIAFGNGQWRYDGGLKFSSSISSSRQLAVRIRFLIQQHDRIQKYRPTSSSRIDFVKASEMYTSQICNGCHHKSLNKMWQQIKFTNQNGVETWRWKQTRTFQCDHDSHQGIRNINRDRNASANIALNVILFAFDLLNDTTWKIGKIGV